MLRNTKTLRRRMPLESRSLHLTRKIQNLDLESKENKHKNQVGRGPDEPNGPNGPVLTPMSEPEPAPVEPVATSLQTEDKGIVSSVTKTASGIFDSIGSLVPGLNEKSNETQDPTNQPETVPEQDATEDINQESEQEQVETQETKSLLSEGLDDVRKKYAEFYGVNEEDIIVDEDGDDITKTGETTLLVGTDNQTKFSKNLKKGERVAVLFGITPGLKSGLLVYPDYDTVKSASTGKEMYNARVVFDKLTVPFDDVKPGYSVKILVCYIETIAPVVEGEKLRLPYIPSISIVNYTTKETTTIDDQGQYDQEGQEGEIEEDTFTGTLEDENNLTSTFTEESGTLEDEEEL